jgi:hypothetical protein
MTFPKDLPLGWLGRILIALVRFRVIRHPQPHAWAPTVNAEELDAGFFERLENDAKRRATGLVSAAL